MNRVFATSPALGTAGVRENSENVMEDSEASRPVAQAPAVE